MEEGSNGDFMQQFGGSASANLLFGVLIMLYMGLKKACDRPSKCKSQLHCGCIDVEVQDKTIHDKIEIEIHDDGNTDNCKKKNDLSENSNGNSL